MKEIKFENEENNTKIFNLPDIDTDKIAITEKYKGIFTIKYDDKPLKVEIKAFCGIIRRGQTFKRGKFITLVV